MTESESTSSAADSQLYLYTSFSSGSSAIVTATSRLQTILNANRIPFQALDVATDEKARKLWGRRAGKRKLPALVRDGMIVADLEQVEEWNEYGEIKDNLVVNKASIGSTKAEVKPLPVMDTASKPLASKPPQTPSSTASLGMVPSTASPVISSILPESTKSTMAVDSTPAKSPAQVDPVMTLADTLRQAGFEAAKKAEDAKSRARKEALGKIPSAEVQKSLDSSGPPGMPPPIGITSSVDAKAPTTTIADGSSKAHDVLTKSEKEVTPSSAKVDEEANKAIAEDDLGGEVLEGVGQAEPEQESKSEPHAEAGAVADPGPVPTSKEAEKAANVAIGQDEETALKGITATGSKNAPSDIPRTDSQSHKEASGGKEIDVPSVTNFVSDDPITSREDASKDQPMVQTSPLAPASTSSAASSHAASSTSENKTEPAPTKTTLATTSSGSIADTPEQVEATSTQGAGEAGKVGESVGD